MSGLRPTAPPSLSKKEIELGRQAAAALEANWIYFRNHEAFRIVPRTEGNGVGRRVAIRARFENGSFVFTRILI